MPQSLDIWQEKPSRSLKLLFPPESVLERVDWPHLDSFFLTYAVCLWEVTGKMTAVPLKSSNTRLLEFKGDLGDDLSVLLPFLTKGNSSSCRLTLPDEMQSGVICGIISAVLQISPLIMKSWLNYCSPPLECIAFFLSAIFKSKHQFIWGDGFI